jgi:TolA-binding protein
MKRLVEQTHPSGTVEQRAKALLAAVGATRVPPGQKQRVREKLLRTPLKSRSRGAPLGVRLALALALLGLATVSAALMTWFVRSHSAEPEHVVAPPDEAPASTDLAPQQKAPVPEPVTVIPSTIPSERAAPPAQPAPPAHKRSEAQAAEPDTEASLLFDATRALRHEGNPGKARRILSEYRRKFPGGAMSEEAMALSIEVAQRQGDPEARHLAARYLERYPSGHFRSRAERVLEASP